MSAFNIIIWDEYAQTEVEIIMDKRRKSNQLMSIRNEYIQTGGISRWSYPTGMLRQR